MPPSDQRRRAAHLSGMPPGDERASRTREASFRREEARGTEEGDSLRPDATMGWPISPPLTHALPALFSMPQLHLPGGAECDRAFSYGIY